MNAGLNGLPGGAQARRVVGLLRSVNQTLGVASLVNMAKAAQAGAVSAVANINQLQLITNISGKGALLWGCITGVGSGDQRVVLEVDGVVVLDQTTTVSSSSNGVLFVGGGFYNSSTSDGYTDFQCIPFSSSVRIFVANSVTGSGNPACYLNAEIHA